MPTYPLTKPDTGDPFDTGPTQSTVVVGDIVDWINETGGISQADWIIYTDGADYFARDGHTGETVYTNADPAAVLSNVLLEVASDGGTIVFKSGVYDWQSVPALPANTTKWIKIIGEGDVTVNLSSGGRRFLDFDRNAAGDTFNFFHIEGFTIDAAGTSALTGRNHVVIGTFQAASTLSGQDVNFDHIVIRRIKTLNVATNAVTTTTQNLNIWIAIHVTTNATQFYMTNIVVEQCEFNGGAYGIGLYGTNQSGFTSFNPDIWEDNIVIRDVYHDTELVPTVFGNMANVHLGSHARGGRCWVQNVTGKNSADVGIEVDNFLSAYITDCYLEDWNGFGIAITNFQAPVEVNQQVYFLRGITGRKNGTSHWQTNSHSLIGMVQSNNRTSNLQPFGRVIASQVALYAKDLNWDTGVASSYGSINGHLASLKLPMVEFSLTQATYYATGLQHTLTTGTILPRVISTTPVARPDGTDTKVTIRDVDMYMAGTYGIGSNEIDTVGIYLSGVVDAFIENIKVRYNLTNVASLSERGIQIGQAAGSIVQGTIRNLEVVNEGSTARGILVSATTSLTIPDTKLRIIDCDFSAMTGTAIAFGDSTNQGKCWVHDTIHDQLASEVNVKSYGATGSGTTDDTAAIQAAIDSLPTTGGTVYFPEGRYLCNGVVTTKSGLILRGAGGPGWDTLGVRGSSQIRVPDGGIGITWGSSSADGSAGIEVRDMDFAPVATTTPTIGLKIFRARRFTLRNVTFANFGIDAVTTHAVTEAGSIGLLLDKGGATSVRSNGSLYECIFLACTKGVHVNGFIGVGFYGCTFDADANQFNIVASSIGAHVAGDNARFFGCRFISYNIGADVANPNAEFSGCHWESFGTAIHTTATATKIFGGSATNSVSGAGGTFLHLDTGSSRGMMVLPRVASVGTFVQDDSASISHQLWNTDVGLNAMGSSLRVGRLETGVNATLGNDTSVVIATAAAGNITLTLPAASTVQGRIYFIRRRDGSANTLTLAPASGNIEGVASITLAANTGVTLVAASTGWWKIP